MSMHGHVPFTALEGKLLLREGCVRADIRRQSSPVCWTDDEVQCNAFSVFRLPM